MSTTPTPDVTPARRPRPPPLHRRPWSPVSCWPSCCSGVGVVFLRDALLAAGALTGSPWLTWFADKAEVISASSPWMLWAGPVAVVVGLILVVAALKPRKATHWAAEEPGVYIGRADAAGSSPTRRTSRPPSSPPGPDVSGRRALRVTARTVSNDTAGVTTEVDRAVTHRLAALRPTPSVRTRVVTSSPKED